MLGTVADARAQTVSSGVKLGLNYATIPTYDEAVGQEPANATARIGPLGGLFLRLGVAKRVDIQPEVLLSLKGTRFDPIGPPAEFAINLAYLEIPLLARVALPRRGRATLYLIGGPAVAFKIADDMDPATDAARFGIDVRTIDAAYVVGGGVEVGRTGIEARFVESFTNIAENDERFLVSLENRTVVVAMSYRF